MNEQQIQKLNDIATEAHDRDPEIRAQLSATDFGDWAAVFDAADMDDLAARVRATLYL